MKEQFITKSLQLGIFIHASGQLRFLRAEADAVDPRKVNFVFEDLEGRAAQIQLNFNRGAEVAARDLFASQTFLRKQMSDAMEISKIGESSNGNRASKSLR
jgi:hypothetical protein